MSKRNVVSLGSKILYSSVGVGSGMVAHRFSGLYRKKMEKSIKEHLNAISASKIGPATVFLSLILPEDEVKYFVSGMGLGITIDNVIQRTFEKYTVESIGAEDTETIDYVNKFSSLLHIDPNLPLKDNESIILPYFPSVITTQRSNPLQIDAINRVIKETGINTKRPGLVDAYWLQQWYLYYGIYQANEGLWPGHDRIRTLSKLLRVRDSGYHTKDGHPAFLFDCDDGAIGTAQIMDYLGYPVKFGLISQKQERVDGIYPLHHIFPVFKAGGRLWIVETIKNLPIVPMEYIHELFNGLKRVVIVNETGSYYEYLDWKMRKIKDKLTEGSEVLTE